MGRPSGRTEFLEIAHLRKLTIAIDGPSGAGKSTVAAFLAKRLGYLYIDTGAMYRAVAVKAKERAIGVDDEEALVRLASSLRIRFSNEETVCRIFCDDREITEAIRSPEISLLASAISEKRGVREALVRTQRLMAKGGGVILEGRDIGTVVFPDAEVKFYLDAQPEERARRRFKELMGKGLDVDYRTVLEEVNQRDRKDMNRSLSPLKKAEDAILIDSTCLSVDEVVEKMVKVVRDRCGKEGGR